jgi:hypothetical protein
MACGPCEFRTSEARYQSVRTLVRAVGAAQCPDTLRRSRRVQY